MSYGTGSPAQAGGPAPCAQKRTRVRTFVRARTAPAWLLRSLTASGAGPTGPRPAEAVPHANAAPASFCPMPRPAAKNSNRRATQADRIQKSGSYNLWVFPVIP